MFDVISVVTTGAVADNSTFTTAFPTGRNAGSYAGGWAHKLIALGTTYSAPKDFTLAFTTLITATWKADVTIPARTKLLLQVDRLGGCADSALPVGVSQAVLHCIDLGIPNAADDNGICASQTVTSSSPTFLLNGALGTTLDVPRNVVGAWTNTAVITITGKDSCGNTIVEKSASGASHIGKKAFKSITSVTTNATVTGATIGTGDVLGLPVRLPTAAHILAEYQNGVLQVGSKAPIALTATSPSLADASQVYIVSPVDGEIVGVRAVTNVVVATADSTITVKTAAGTVGGLVITTAASAVGDVFNIDAIANATVAKGATIEIENDAAASAGAVLYTVLVRPRNGIITAAVDTTPTATTGDVRGTYDPITACDGVVTFSLYAVLPDPTDKGVPQYAG